MKASELQAGKTYVGKGGRRRRYLHDLRCAGIADWLPMGMVIAEYDLPDGGVSACSARAFARWAEREATPEETAP